MDGIWTASQLRETRTRSEIRTEVRNGGLFLVTRGIYSDREPDADLVLKALAEVRGLVYTGWTAINLYLDREVIFPVRARRAGGSRCTSDAVVTAGVPGRLRHRKHLPLVSPLQAAVDADGPDEELRVALGHMYSGIRAGEDIERDVAALVSNRKRARSLLSGAAVATASTLEKKAFVIIRDALADLPVTLLTNTMVGDYSYDLVIPEAKVAVEIDSYTYHGAGGSGANKRGFIKDTWKRNDLAVLGWVGQSFTDSCINREADRVSERMRQIVVPRISQKNREIPGPQDDPVWRWHSMLTRW